MSFPCLVSTYARIMSSPDGRERNRLVHNANEVVSFLACPQMCYHLFIEQYFEWEHTSSDSCNNMCSYCIGHTSTFTGPIHRHAVESTLCLALLQNRQATPESLRNAIMKERDIIFVNKVGKRAGPVHALLLQLYSKGMFRFYIEDKNVIGTDKVSIKHVMVEVLFDFNEHGHRVPAYQLDNRWEGINCHVNN